MPEQNLPGWLTIRKSKIARSLQWSRRHRSDWRRGKKHRTRSGERLQEDTAVPFQVLPFSDGPGALDTEFVLGKEFIRDIAKIEPQSVWDNGSIGGNVGWLDASQDKNIAKSVMGTNLYEVTWSGDAIRIHNNGSATANEMRSAAV